MDKRIEDIAKKAWFTSLNTVNLEPLDLHKLAKNKFITVYGYHANTVMPETIRSINTKLATVILKAQRLKDKVSSTFPTYLGKKLVLDIVLTKQPEPTTFANWARLNHTELVAKPRKLTNVVVDYEAYDVFMLVSKKI